ncbi:MAG: hypothetical protein Q9175_000977 [Cornicularia normoerica]
MPPKIKPRPRQLPRNNRGTTQEHGSVEALSALSPKETLASNDNEVQDTSDNAGQTDAPETQLDIPTSRIVSASTSNLVAGSPPPKRSVQRLKSALPRITPNATHNSNAADGSDNRPTGLKFKPKSFIRRSKEEREAEEKAEAERRAARQAAQGMSSTSDRSGYNGRGRGRGQRGGFGDMSRWKNERFNVSHEASGHLGGSTIQDVATSKNRRGEPGPSESTSTNGTSRVKNEPAVKPEKDRDGDVVMSSSTSKPNRTKVKKEYQGPTYVSSEGELDPDGGERVNIEDINAINLVSSEDEDEDEEPFQQSRVSKGKRREAMPRVPGSDLMPVRIQRREHVERSVGVNTDASSLTSAELRRRAKNRAEAGGSLFLPEEEEADILSATKPKVNRKPKDVEFVRDERKWKGVYQDEDDKEDIVRIKDEPKDDRDVMMTDKPMGEEEAEPIPLDDIDLANTSRQRTTNDRDGTLRARLKVMGEPKEEDPLPQSSERLRKIKGYRGLRRVEISEEEEEDDIFAGIAEIVLTKGDDLSDNPGPELASSTDIPDDDDDDGDLDMDREDTYFRKGGKEEVYLFQLPPVVPSLRNISIATPKSEDKKKNKAVSAEATKSSALNNPFAAQVKNETNIKPDPDELLHETTVPHAYTSNSFHSIGGRGGVLSIHAKGSMLATWGGMSFEISKEGTGAKLAQELMMTEFESAATKVEDESRWEERVDVGKVAWAMGQTHPGHVCIPELLS